MQIIKLPHVFKNTQSIIILWHNYHHPVFFGNTPFFFNKNDSWTSDFPYACTIVINLVQYMINLDHFKNCEIMDNHVVELSQF